MNECAIGVDIGGTNIRVGLVNENLELTGKQTALTDSFESADALFAGIRQMIEFVDEDRRARRIGIAMPVPWRNGAEYIVDATNIPCLENMPIETIHTYFPGYEVYLENDVNVIAILESEHGASKGCSHSMYITVSTGIASGMIVHNEIYHGAHGYAGEIGSMIISEENRNNRDSSDGTLETLCSGKALQEVSRELFGPDATTKTLFEQYHCQDVRARAVIELWVDRFSSAVSSLIQTMDPDIVVIGGAVLDNNPWLIDKMREIVRGRVLHHLRDRTRIVRPVFGPDGGLIGAGYIALKQSRQALQR